MYLKDIAGTMTNPKYLILGMVDTIDQDNPVTIQVTKAEGDTISYPQMDRFKFIQMALSWMKSETKFVKIVYGKIKPIFYSPKTDMFNPIFHVTYFCLQYALKHRAQVVGDCTKEIIPDNYRSRGYDSREMAATCMLSKYFSTNTVIQLKNRSGDVLSSIHYQYFK